MLQYTPYAANSAADLLEDYVLSERLAAAPQSAPPAAQADTTESDRVLALILSSLDDDKAEDVVSIPLAGKSSFADHMVVASGRSSRQVSAIAEKLLERLKAETGRIARVEGRETGDWVLIDCGDAIVHLFRPEVREFYQLEKMWTDLPTPGGSAAS